jgi:uncharacterized protein
MSEENVEVVRRLYKALGRDDWDGVFRDAHPGIEMTTQAGLMAGTFRGRDAIQRQIEDVRSPYDVWAMEPDQFFEGGDSVVAFVRITSRPKGGSVDMEVRVGHLWTIREGRIQALKTFPVREEALEAAGLSE